MKYLGLALGLGLGLLATSCGGDDATDATSASATYFQDMAPLFEEHCMHCHREGGVGPFRLDDYATAKSWAPRIKAATAARTMPPWAVTSDGSCGDFKDSLALTDQQIERIADWAEHDAPEGTPAKLTVPALPTLDGATELSTPVFTPEIQGGALAAADEYRCFALDSGVTDLRFITGYEVIPGLDSVVHHVLVMLVDGEASSQVQQGQPSRTNLEQMQALDAETPDRDGWPCFGMAGEGLNVESVPVTWAPGQGVVRYPNSSGIPLAPKHQVIVQVHYNLVNPVDRGQSDQTLVRLRLDSDVPNVGVFALQDPFLDSLFKETSDSLPPSRASTQYAWQMTLEQIGFGSVEEVELHGIIPHMHQLGKKYQFRVDADGSGAKCAADVQQWDFHWQRMYLYQQPYKLNPQSRVEVTCDFDTSRTLDAVLPGWGTSNEMCLAALYFTMPRSAAGL